MKRREFLRNASAGLAGVATATTVGSRLLNAQELKEESKPQSAPPKPKDYRKEPFQRLVILGESTVHGGPWLPNPDHDRYADVLVRMINACQEKPIEYFNMGIGANAISPRSPGYEKSVKPSALERYKKDVIENQPDLFILAYGLNDMRADMPIEDFREDMATIIRDVQQACHPVTVLTTVYYMTSWEGWPPYNKGSIDLTLKYNECIRSLAEEFDCILADVWKGEAYADWLIHNDGVHANLVGNIVIAGRIFEAIAKHNSGLTNWAFAQVANNDWTQSTMKARAYFGDPFKKTW